jgi:hypothetical protein
MYVTEAVRTSLAEILAHKLRSGLTLVGIVLGTTALVVMVEVLALDQLHDEHVGRRAVAERAALEPVEVGDAGGG